MYTPARLAMKLYRISNFCYRHNMEKLAKIVKYIGAYACSIEIDYRSVIGKGFVIHHGYGSVIGCIMGSNVHISHAVSIGGNWGKKKEGRGWPIIGDNVWIMPGAMILGPVTIGSNVIIGVSSLVMSDVPDNSVVAGSPAKVIRPISERDLEILMKPHSWVEG